MDSSQNKNTIASLELTKLEEDATGAHLLLYVVRKKKLTYGKGKITGKVEIKITDGHNNGIIRIDDNNVTENIAPFQVIKITKAVIHKNVSPWLVKVGESSDIAIERTIFIESEFSITGLATTFNGVASYNITGQVTGIEQLKTKKGNIYNMLTVMNHNAVCQLRMWPNAATVRMPKVKDYIVALVCTGDKFNPGHLTTTFDSNIVIIDQPISTTIGKKHCISTYQELIKAKNESMHAVKFHIVAFNRKNDLFYYTCSKGCGMKMEESRPWYICKKCNDKVRKAGAKIQFIVRLYCEVDGDEVVWFTLFNDLVCKMLNISYDSLVEKVRVNSNVIYDLIEENVGKQFTGLVIVNNSSYGMSLVLRSINE